MASLQELQQRVAVAAERNRTNVSNRERLLAEAKDKFGCDSLDALRKVEEEKAAEVVRLEAEEAAAKERAERAVLAVEVAVGGAK